MGGDVEGKREESAPPCFVCRVALRATNRGKQEPNILIRGDARRGEERDTPPRRRKRLLEKGQIDLALGRER
eukprot:scaffold12012_cov25-Tisochrysis_lutea.AAC.1